MTRIYDPLTLVELPRLDASSAAAIATSLASAAASEKKLPATVVAALKLLHGANKALQVALVTGLTAPPESPLAGALRDEAAVWAGIETWLKGIVRAGGADGVPHAEKLLAALYPAGLAFLRGPAAKRWSASDARIQRIGQDQLAADFATLGGAGLLANLQTKHQATGVAAGITAAKLVIETPPVREKFDALKAALRALVLQVVANVSLDPEPEAQALASRLLHPLTSYVPPEVVAKAAAATGAAAAQGAAAGQGAAA